MKKKFFAVILTLALIITALPADNALFGILAPFVTSADALQSGDFYYAVLEDGTVEITDYTGSASSLTIPNTLGGKTVTKIGGSAFSACKSLKSITIPNSVTIIEYEAFGGCISLITVTIPNSVTSIGNFAFICCINLTLVTIPDSVTSIGLGAFSWCTSLTTINVNVNNMKYTSVNGFLFNKDKTTLICCPGRKTSVTIPDNVTSIGDFAFEGCTSLTSVTIPDSVTSIGVCAFSCCTGLTSITIPDSVTSIGDYAFNDCTSLTSVVIPYSVMSIGSEVFFHCINLTLINVDVNNANYTSDDGVLYNKDKRTLIFCPGGKTSVTIPVSVTSIGEGAFEGCISLISITFPDNVTSIESEAFNGCTSLTSVTIPDSVTYIGRYAFKDCTSLTSVTIPDSVTSIGECAFGYYYDESTWEYKKAAYFTIKGTPNSAAKTYAKENGFAFVNVNAKAISACKVTLSATTYTYSGSAKKPTVTVKDGTKTLVSGTDYTVAYTNNIKKGTATVTITGVGSYSGTLKKTFTIKAKTISTCTADLSAKSFTYSGASKKPTVTVKDGTKTLVLGTDYTVTYANNVRIGTATMTITGKGNYSGTLKKTFSIKLGVSTAKVKAGTKKASISWSKVTGASGYEVYMSTSKDGTYTLVKSTTLLSFTKTGLTSGKTYYFKIRAYTTVNGAKVYGAYTSAVKVVAS